jgi:hypothetical protein
MICGMRKLLVVAALLVSGAAAGYAYSDRRPPQAAVEDICGLSSQSQVRTTLYFGMSRPTGAVSELDWQLFVRDEVTPRFPEGLTSWDAQGQWKGKSGAIEQERSKVLLLVHSDGAAPKKAVLEIIEEYRKKFQQESVLWERARVCVAS